MYLCIYLFLNTHPKKYVTTLHPSILVLSGTAAYTDNTIFCSESWIASSLIFSDLEGSGITDYSCGDSILRSISIQYAVREWDSGNAERKTNIITRYGSISDWDVTNVLSMNHLFADRCAFNSDLSKWESTNVQNLAYMFSMKNCPDNAPFNSKLTNFDTSKVTTMTNMFNNAQQFNQQINNFNTENVVDLSYMFMNAKQFGGDLLNFDTSKVSNMECNFQGATNFNGDLSSYETAQVTQMGGMLGGSSFNRTVCGGSWVHTDMNQLLNPDNSEPFQSGRLGCCSAGLFMSNPFLDPFSLVGSCDACPSGRFASAENDDTSCQGKCPAGKSNVPSSTTIYSCEDCPSSKYSSIGGGSTCHDCPVGKSTPNQGSISISECRGCSSGKILVTESPLVCSTCPAGTFQPSPHLDPNVKCQNCVGKYIKDDGNDVAEHDSIDDCKYCQAGTKFISISKECQICDAGKYQISNQISSVSCVSCDGRYIIDDGTDKTEHDSIDDCKYCIIGKTFDSISTECTVCGYSQYQDASNIASIKCKTCPANTYITDDKKSEISHQQKSDCVACAVGKFAAAGQRACDVCNAGTEQISSGCTDCVSGQFSKDPRGGCKECPKGYYQEDAGTAYCLPCLPGTYQEDAGREKCDKCPKNTKSENANSIECQNCKLGRIALKGASSCSQCDPGKYGSSKTGECMVCQAGQYQNSKGETSCKLCDVDKYLSEEGKSSDAECVACNFKKSTGMKKGNNKATSCQCRKNDYYKNEDDDSCIVCPTGADCSKRDGLLLSEVYAKPGYYRYRDTFVPCSQGVYAKAAKETAEKRCCPLMNVSDTSICSNKMNVSDKVSDTQCLKG